MFHVLRMCLCVISETVESERRAAATKRQSGPAKAEKRITCKKPHLPVHRAPETPLEFLESQFIRSAYNEMKCASNKTGLKYVRDEWLAFTL